MKLEMNRRIRIVGGVLVAFFVLVFLQLNNLQVLQAKKLADNPENVEHLLSQLAVRRGEILSANGTVLADSEPSHDLYKYRRLYPTGSLFAQVVGYDSIIYGTDGVEATENAELTGHKLPVRNLADLLAPQVKVANVVLTIPTSLQRLAQKELGGYKGAVVALDPRTGAVLAMYSSPSFNPNPLASHDATTEHDAWKSYLANPSQPMLNRAISRAYPPGSTFKIVTSSAVYEHDPAIAKISFPVLHALKLPETSHLLHNYNDEACGGLMPLLLAVSCDSGYGQIGLDLGASVLHEEADAFGFNSRPPLDLPDVAASTFPPVSSFHKQLPLLAFSAIGQGNDNATALQMALVASAIADAGTIMTPHVVAELTDPQGQVIERTTPKVWRTATTPLVAAKVRALMTGVVNHGTATVLQLSSVQVAAKTGTAQGSIYGDTNWMVAFAPASDPTVALAVVVPAQPKIGHGTTGAQIAGPIARAMLQAALAYQSARHAEGTGSRFPSGLPIVLPSSDYTLPSPSGTGATGATTTGAAGTGNGGTGATGVANSVTGVAGTTSEGGTSTSTGGAP